MKKTLNILGIFFSVILSVVLFVTLIASPLVNMVSTAFRPDTFKKIIQRIDFVELVLSNEELREELSTHGIDAQFLDEIKESRIVAEGVDAFIEGLFEGKAFTKDIAMNIIDQSHEEAVYYIKGLSKRLGRELHELPDEEVKRIILDSFDKNWDSLTKALPTPEELGITQEDYNAINLLDDTIGGKALTAGQVFKAFYDGAVMNLFLIVAALLSALILLLRFPRFKGFIWLFVVYLLASILTFGVGAVVNAVDVSVISELERLQDEILAPILSVIVGIIRGGAWTLLGFAVLWLGVYIAFTVLKKVHNTQTAVLELTEDSLDLQQSAIEESTEEVTEEPESIDDIIASAEELIYQSEPMNEEPTQQIDYEM